MIFKKKKLELEKKTKERKFILFQPPDNEEVQESVKKWLLEAKGSMTLGELEKRFDEKFHFFYPQIYTEDDLNSNSSIESWKKFVFRLENNIVFYE